MRSTHEKFKIFSSMPIADAHKTTCVLVAISLDSKKAVDDMIAKIFMAGPRGRFRLLPLKLAGQNRFSTNDGPGHCENGAA